MKHYISPNDPQIMADNDARSVANAIRKAKETGGSVIIPRKNARTGEALWVFHQAVLLPSDIEMILDNCHIRQADGVMDNLFRNENVYDENRVFTDRGKQHGIHIRGVGNAILDGGKPNGLMELTSGKDGRPNVDANNCILLHHVDDFTIENLEIRDQRWWGINILFCSHGRIADIRINARNNIPNQDGIDIRMGCSNLLIENISGQSGDDLVALTSQGGSMRLFPEGGEMDTHDIRIRNILGTSARQCIVALRNHDGSRMYNITIENVMDTANNDRNNFPYGVLRVGENLYYRQRCSVLGETCNIRAKNIFSTADETVCLGASLQDSSFENIYVSGTAHCAVSTDTLPHQNGGVTMQNVTFRGIRFSGKADHFEVAKIQKMRETDTLKNVTFTGIIRKGEESGDIRYE